MPPSSRDDRSANVPDDPGATLTDLRPRDAGWPHLWRTLTDPPDQVTVSGRVGCLQSPCIAIVGTRKATPRGLAVARGLAAALSHHGWTVVSGLALGIDAAAHRGSLDAGGAGVAVMATGIDVTYPVAHGRLRSRLERLGCCLTEFPAGTRPLPYHFPRRNRLIAGLARAVVVVEAPLKSGAMVTAYLALDYDREVFAVPGPVDLDTSRGCHHLLREGAHLLESCDDVHRVLPPPVPRPGPDAPAADRLPQAGSPARWILDRLDLEGVSRDGLRRRWPGTEDMWVEGLLALELGGLIQRLPGGRLARTIWR